MADELRISFTESELRRAQSAFHWLCGYVEGTGRQVPPSIIGQLTKLFSLLPEQNKEG